MTVLAASHPVLSRLLGGVRRLAVATTIGALAVDAITIGASAAHAEDQVGISGVPAGADGVADGRSRFSYAADPGQQVADHYLVRNTGTTTSTFTVIATDAFNDEDGEFALLETETAPVRAGAWVSFENGSNRIQFDLDPGASRVLPFTLVVPAGASPGDHAGGIVASVISSGTQVNLDRRLGTRLYVRVSGDLQPMLTLSSVEADYLGDWWNPFTGSVRVRYSVNNTGNIALASNVSLGVNTWFGAPASARSGDGIPELLPGTVRNYETVVPSVAAWGYLNPWVKLNPFVEGDPDKRMPVAATERDAVLIAMPWPLVILLVLIAGVILFRRWRRRVDAERAAEWIAYTEDEARRKVEAELVGAGERNA